MKCSPVCDQVVVFETVPRTDYRYEWKRDESVGLVSLLKFLSKL